MARITKTEEKTFTTIDEAARFVRNIDGRVGFMVKVEAFLPTTDNKGFPGMTFLTVSRRQFIEVIRGMGTTLVDERGGKIVLRIDARDDYSTSRPIVTMY